MSTQDYLQAGANSGEHCVVCDKTIDGNSGTSHVYHQGRPFALCCPMCLQMFERARDRFARGERPQSLLDELMAKITWKT